MVAGVVESLLRFIAAFARRIRADWHQPVIPVLLFFVVLVFTGAGGLVYFEGEAGRVLTWADGVWWAVVTMTTVGYGDVVPTTIQARYFVGIPIMILGIGVMGYLLSVAASRFVERRTRALKGVRKMNFTSHLLIIYYQNQSRVAHVIEQLRDEQLTAGLPLVLVDGTLDELPRELADTGLNFVKGPPELAATLAQACAGRARAALVLSKQRGDPESDFANLAVVNALRAESPDLYIVSEGVDPARIDLLKRAGANSVICSTGLASALLAQEVADPGTQAVVYELMRGSSRQQIYIVGIESLGEWTYAELRNQMDGQDATLVGVARQGEIVLNPGQAYAVEKGDRAICVSDKRPDAVGAA